MLHRVLYLPQNPTLSAVFYLKALVMVLQLLLIVASTKGHLYSLQSTERYSNLSAKMYYCKYYELQYYNNNGLQYL